MPRPLSSIMRNLLRIFSDVSYRNMVTPESIRASIAQGLAAEHLSVSGDGTHFEAVVVSSAFAGRSRVQRHQMVYRALGERMRGEIHALSMKTWTPQEWEGSC